MSLPLPLLDRIEIASPCPASWEEMTGTDRVRFCEQCHLQAYNLSAMGRGEAERLLRDRSGRLCVRLFRRADGTVLTQDCPRGLEAMRRAARRALVVLITRAVAVVALVLGPVWLLWGDRIRSAQARLGKVDPFQSILSWLEPPAPPAVMGDAAPQGIGPANQEVLGKVCPPAPAPQEVPQRN